MARAEENHLDPLSPRSAGVQGHAHLWMEVEAAAHRVTLQPGAGDSLSQSPARLVPASDPEQGGSAGIWHSQG